MMLISTPPPPRKLIFSAVAIFLTTAFQPPAHSVYIRSRVRLHCVNTVLNFSQVRSVHNVHYNGYNRDVIWCVPMAQKREENDRNCLTFIRLHKCFGMLFSLSVRTKLRMSHIFKIFYLNNGYIKETKKKLSDLDFLISFPW